MAEQLRVVVTSAGGRVGKEICARLKQSGRNVFIRACCRRPERSEFLKDLGVDELVQFEYSDPSTFEAAVKGMNAIYSSSPDPALKGHQEFCTFLKNNKHGIKHAVRLSCMGAEQNTASYSGHAFTKGAKIPHMLEGYWLAEKYLIETGIPVTVVRANFFMTHLVKPDLQNIMEHGFFTFPLSDCRNSFVSTNDLGEIAAKALVEGPSIHGDKFYDITGPEPQSMYDVADVLSEVLGKKIEYRETSPEKFIEDFGQTRWEFIEYLRKGFYLRVSPDYYNLTGKKSTNYLQHMTTKGAAGETGTDELSQAGMWTKGVDLFKNKK
ncbi:(4-alkanoyl-5-oxo-2,5-dihydrofuran-3-yl)methyl phosphate reductase-like [Hydractinia symbiolongicarpus]|uniref:(4-alkanoyl-5-oxo-2,5-dihydrofuran-3-yl)methyl phosphate reductase-like n=1 Tax=Hydractinia symbiolongicarpus TaxID=13093 RepID=UPI00255135A5|nr:(4-alkanoyl-5-oxo-2,5-dihydrofuran-3-yl)methyl phosphate reductase-like [Hydractinia symbiolongicarpus]